MTKLKEDIRDLSKWSQYVYKDNIYEVTLFDMDSVYVNTHDQSITVANSDRPILVRDADKVYWAVSMEELCSKYTYPDGKPIKLDIYEQIRYGAYVQVKARAVALWAFHVDVNVYRYDCPYGANKASRFVKTGDYLVCSGDTCPDLATIEVVHEEVFKRNFMKKEVRYV